MKKTIIDNLIETSREAENLLLESSTEMAEHTNKQRKKFYERAMKLKNKSGKIYNYLVKKVGIDEEYLNKLLTNEGI